MRSSLWPCCWAVRCRFTPARRPGLVGILTRRRTERDLERHQPATARRPPQTRGQGHHCRHRPHKGGRLLGVRWRRDARYCFAGSAGIFAKSANSTKSFSNPQVFITGDVMARIPEIPPDRLDTPRLSATIRALGRAASSSACVAETAHQDLERSSKAQAHAMVTQETPKTSTSSTTTAPRPYRGTGTAAQPVACRRSDDLLFEYVTTLAPASHVFSAFLRDLAAVGAETQELADAAREVWPTLFAARPGPGGRATGHLRPERQLQ